MARRDELPAALAVIGRRGTPWRADLAGGAVAAVISVLAGPAAAIALSACSVLVYYAVINLAALRLRPDERRWPVWTSWTGFVLCLALAALLPVLQVFTTVVVLGIGWMLVTVLGGERSR